MAQSQPASSPFPFVHELPFAPTEDASFFRQLPEAPGLLALFGPPSDPPAQPFLTRTANLRRRAVRLLEARPLSDQPVSRRLNLRDRVARIAFSPTGSDFESLLLLYQASAALFGLPEARRRLRLHTPFFLRFAVDNAFPRLYVTNRLSRRSLHQTFGPFPSRVAAERFTEAVLDLFKLRRCWEDLVVHPSHPGCAYGEMQKCLTPCNATCTPADYAAEAHAVEQFLRTRGEALLATVAADRDRASEEMDFEKAADLHRQHEKIKAAIALADPLVRPIPDLHAALVLSAAPPAPTTSPNIAQIPAPQPTEPTENTPLPSPLESTTPAATPPSPTPGPQAEVPQQAAVFLLHRGVLTGPQLLSTLGVRAVREQTAVGSSLFAQPLMLAAIPLGPPSPSNTAHPPANEHPSPQPTAPDAASSHSALDLSSEPLHIAPTSQATLSPEERARAVLASLTLRSEAIADPDPALLSDHLAMLRRWYYRPEKQRVGDLLTPNPDGSWPLRRLLNAAARSALGTPKAMQSTNRDAARAVKTRLLHVGREGVEREVPVLTPDTILTPENNPAHPVDAAPPPTFRSRRRKLPAAEPFSTPADKLHLP